MHEALSLLVELEAEDADWLLDAAEERSIRRDEDLIVEGADPEHLFLVLEGVFEIRSAAVERPLATIGSGELLGELSFLDEGPASASVRALEDGIVLAVPRARLASRLEEDSRFAVRFLRALGRVTAARLRAQNARSAAAREGAGAPGDVPADGGPWAALAPGLRGFKELMQAADDAARKTDGRVPDELVQRAAEGMDALCVLLREQLGEESSMPATTRQALGERIQQEMLPYLLMTRLVERIYAKPRGYAGDYLTIEWIYRNEPGGTGSLGPLIDTLFLARPAAQAVRNRRGILAEEIRRSIDEPGARGAVTSLACGPAEELFDVYAGLDDPQRLRSTLIDIDLSALALVSDRCEREGLKKPMKLQQANLVYLATGRQQLDLPEQDLMYSIGLIDYFQDRFVVALLDWMHSRLRPGGRAILGNFRTGNPDRALMDHVLDWKLIHRSEDDMNRLFAASRFGSGCAEIRYEPARVNLFAIGVRS